MVSLLPVRYSGHSRISFSRGRVSATYSSRRASSISPGASSASKLAFVSSAANAGAYSMRASSSTRDRSSNEA